MSRGWSSLEQSADNILNEVRLRVAVYYRSRPNESAASVRSLVEQRGAVADWRAGHSNAEIIAELTEDESQSEDRPALKAAIESCRKFDASLVVASTEAIGRGPPFHPRIQSVPVIKLHAPNRPIGHVKALPPRAPKSLALYFDNHAEGLRSDVYLCNGSTELIHGVVVRILGTTMSFSGGACPASGANESTLSGDACTTPTQIVRVETLLPGAASLITDYDALVDGDFILVFEVSYAWQSQPQQVRAVIGKGGCPPRFVNFNILAIER